MVDSSDNELVQKFGLKAELEEDPSEDHPDAERLQDLRSEYHAKKLSIDSTFGLVYVQVNDRKYPDIGVCTYGKTDPHSMNPDDKDRVVSMTEVASVPYGSDPTALLEPAKMDEYKRAVLSQLWDYMETLGPEGARWDGYVCGIAMIGCEVAFVEPDRGWRTRRSVDEDGKPPSLWAVFRGLRKQTWHSLYGRVVREKISKIEDIILKNLAQLDE
ncbi:hypothetical protein VTO73DRAFT_8849 [Trametes versicolor]